MIGGLKRKSGWPVLAILMAHSAYAQLAPGSGMLRGELSAESGSPGNKMTVELYDDSRGRVVGRTMSSAGGRFEFGPMQNGPYQIRVSDRSGNIIRREYVNVQGGVSFVNVPISVEKTEEPMSGSVSFAQLRRKTPKGALKEFKKAEKAEDVQTAIRHLEKAIEIDPEYMEAYNNLGSKHVQLKEFDRALPYLQKASALDPAHAMIQTNLASVLWTLNRFEDAERVARRAIELDAGQSKARFVLGMSLRALNRDFAEATTQLSKAALQFPEARLYAAEMAVRTGDRNRAVKELKSYLECDTATERERAEVWLARLQ